MKRKLFIICLLLSSLLLLGCSHGSDDPPLPPVPDNPDQPDKPEDPDNPDDPEPPEPVLVPIQLYASLLSRAAITEFDGTAVSIAMGNNGDAINEVWEGTAAGQQINLSSIHYYPTDSSSVYLWGFHPRTGLSGGRASYTLTGKEDILYADMQSGSLKLPFGEQENKIAFRHLLAQINVSLEAGEEFQGSYRLKYLSLNGSASHASLDVLHGTMDYGTDPLSIAVYTAPGFTGLPIVAGSELSLGYILVQPGAEMTMDLILAKDDDASHDIVFRNLAVTIQSGAGLSYKLSIKLPDEIEPGEPDEPDNPDTPDVPDPPIDPDDPGGSDDPAPPDPSLKEIQITVTISQWVENPSGDVTIE
jgi:hypothetical protein